MGLVWYFNFSTCKKIIVVSIYAQVSKLCLGGVSEGKFFRVMEAKIEVLLSYFVWEEGIANDGR